MRIHEIFLSIQGEGIDSGRPTIFVRTAGCNLRCTWCDTRYAARGRAMSIAQIVEAVAAFPCRRICLTGGEPLHQPESLQLVRTLRRRRCSVSIETNGSYDVRRFLDVAAISLDIKCPASGMAGRMCRKNLAFLRKRDQVKFIVADERDYQFARDLVVREQLARKTNVVFTPVGGRAGRRLAEWILNDGIDVRLGLQLHKILWGAERGR